LNRDSSVAQPIVVIPTELFPAIEKLRNFIIADLEASIEPGIAEYEEELLPVQPTC
jgi:hypothetical protein